MSRGPRLGVTRAKDVRESRECFWIGQSAERVRTSLLFSKHYLANTPEMSAREMESVSVGVRSSGSAAHMLKWKLPPDLQSEAAEYQKSADNLNKRVRAFVKPGQDGTAPPKLSDKERKAITTGVDRLMTKADALIGKAEALCYLEPKASGKRRKKP